MAAPAPSLYSAAGVLLSAAGCHLLLLDATTLQLSARHHPAHPARENICFPSLLTIANKDLLRRAAGYGLPRYEILTETADQALAWSGVWQEGHLIIPAEEVISVAAFTKDPTEESCLLFVALSNGVLICSRVKKEHRQWMTLVDKPNPFPTIDIAAVKPTGAVWVVKDYSGHLLLFDGGLGVSVWLNNFPTVGGEYRVVPAPAVIAGPTGVLLVQLLRDWDTDITAVFLYKIKMVRPNEASLEPLPNIGTRSIVVSRGQSACVFADEHAGMEMNCIYYTAWRTIVEGEPKVKVVEGRTLDQELFLVDDPTALAPAVGGHLLVIRP